MAMILSSLDRVRGRIRTGDPIFYGAARGVAQWIESFTDSDQSHVSMAVVEGPFLVVVESIAGGAQVRPITFNVDKAADVWWLPLRRGPGRDPTDARDRLLEYLVDICERQVPYDLRALFPRQWRNGRPPEDYSRLYCSELVALGLRHLGLYDGTAELTPVEVARLAVFEPDYYALKWDADGPKEIPGYNTVAPMGDPFAALSPAF